MEWAGKIKSKTYFFFIWFDMTKLVFYLHNENILFFVLVGKNCMENSMPREERVALGLWCVHGGKKKAEAVNGKIEWQILILIKRGTWDRAARVFILSVNQSLTNYDLGFSNISDFGCYMELIYRPNQNKNNNKQ